MQLLYCLDTFPASPRCTIKTAEVHRGSYEDHASHEVSGAQPDRPVTQSPVIKTKKEVFQLWERRSHRPILSLETARKGHSAGPDDARQQEVSTVKLVPPVTVSLVTGGANTGSPEVVPYLLVYKSTFYYQNSTQKNRPRLIHESYTNT